MGHPSFDVGDQIRVRRAADILSTLSADGTLDGLPFMPEMLDSCGKTFRVLRRVDKTCVSGHPLRQFPQNDVVILDGPRCDGSAHDGCRHGCRIFWKEAWLESADANTATHECHAASEQSRVRLKVKSDEKRYFCQSTELLHATRVFPDVRFLTVRIALRAVRKRDVPVNRMVPLVLRWLKHKVKRRIGGDHWLYTSRKQTPTASLGLQPGEQVRVKSRQQIADTLDRHGRNRGMGICSEMVRCCEGPARVRYRVDRIVDEETGLMRELSDTVALENIWNERSLAEECLCYGQLGDCPRGELMYWREIWLERVDQGKK